MSAGMGHRRKRACGEGVGTTSSYQGHHVGLRVWARLVFAMQHWSAPLCGVLVHALCAWRVWWNACRDVGYNNLGGELPAQYSALTSLQFWCVAPYPTRSGVAFGWLAVDDLWSRFDSSLWTSLAST